MAAKLSFTHLNSFYKKKYSTKLLTVLIKTSLLLLLQFVQHSKSLPIFLKKNNFKRSLLSHLAMKNRLGIFFNNPRILKKKANFLFNKSLITDIQTTGFFTSLKPQVFSNITPTKYLNYTRKRYLKKTVSLTRPNSMD